MFSFPLVCISVALAVNRRIEIGVVHVPVLDQLFVARKGKGATLNGKKIKVAYAQPFHMRIN
jgi:fructose-1,6-bisphosphatase/inositol monophosphatase family enzyme